jgi:hypothetical protein
MQIGGLPANKVSTPENAKQRMDWEDRRLDDELEL